jgi:hypothetical protein
MRAYELPPIAAYSQHPQPPPKFQLDYPLTPEFGEEQGTAYPNIEENSHESYHEVLRQTYAQDA